MTCVAIGIGQKLIQAFVQQLDGELSVSSGPQGTRHVLKLPIIEPSGSEHATHDGPI